MTVSSIKKTIVLGLFAVLPACSGGATSTDTSADPTGGFRATLPPSVADSDKLALQDTKIDYMLALRSAAKKRALAGVISAPFINWLRRMAPNVSGSTLSKINPAGIHHDV